jgi:ACS family glucarate transporter-like MFS transporter
MSQRYVIVGITAIAALFLYIDRVCISILADPMQTDLGLTDHQKARVLGAFFYTYALLQIPMGSLADRFGPRKVLAFSIGVWSMVTAATGFVWGFSALIGVRLMLGVAEASAYPSAAVLVKRWAHPEERGRFSAAVALGGRVGGAFAPWLTAALAIGLVGFGLTIWSEHNPSGKNWRGVFLLYGMIGVAVAILFWLIVRDHPPRANVDATDADHKRDESAEERHRLPPAQDSSVESNPSAAGPQPTFFHQIRLLARTRNMWLFGALQFGVNLGWVFLITLLPTYLNKVFGVPLEERGRMQTVVLITGCCGMFFGGFVTDALRRRLGPRLGRTVPIAVSLSGCALAFFLVPSLPTAWAIVAALGVMAFLVDLHNPSIWSFAQDVGGKRVGMALGWGNMWGNLGAAVSPTLLTEVRDQAGWNAAFVFCGCAFVAAAICGLLLDATKPVDATDTN